MKTIERIKSNLNPSLDIKGILLTMYDKRNRLSGQVREKQETTLKKSLLNGSSKERRLSEAPSHGIPVLLYDVICPGSKAYLRFTEEFLEKEKKVESAAW